MGWLAAKADAKGLEKQLRMQWGEVDDCLVRSSFLSAEIWILGLT
jgi:hypothetical protein